MLNKNKFILKYILILVILKLLYTFLTIHIRNIFVSIYAVICLLHLKISIYLMIELILMINILKILCQLLAFRIIQRLMRLMLFFRYFSINFLRSFTFYFITIF
jgi:hypothetical protein